MKYSKLFSLIYFAFAPAAVFCACSTNNLTKCLDSVCAINIGANPAARCQYCYSEEFGKPAVGNGEKTMKNISAGTAAKYTLSEKELKKLEKSVNNPPSDIAGLSAPLRRYTLAQNECFKKVKDCTPDDVEEKYFPLLDQSCKAAGIEIKMAKKLEEFGKEKTEKQCANDMNLCMVKEEHCLPDYTNCESDADFDRFFSKCSIESGSGCDTKYIANIRTSLKSDRDNMKKSAVALLQKIITGYQEARKKRLSEIQSGCKDNSAKQKCIKQACATHLSNKCSGKNESFERMLAEQLCKFYDTACSRLK